MSHRDAAPHELRERPGHLVLLAVPPLIWAAHLLLSYCTAAIWCAKAAGRGSPLAPVRIAIVVYTALALAAIGLVGWRAWRRHRLGGSPPPHAFDTRADRHRFLGYSALLLSGLSAVAVAYAGVTAIFLETCR